MNYTLYISIVLLTGLIISCEKSADTADEETIILATSFEKSEDPIESSTEYATKEPSDLTQSKIDVINDKINELKPKLLALRKKFDHLKETEPDSKEKIAKVEAELTEIRGVVRQLQEQRVILSVK